MFIEDLIFVCNTYNIPLANFDEVEGEDHDTTVFLKFYKKGKVEFKTFIKKSTIYKYLTQIEGIFPEDLMTPLATISKLPSVDTYVSKDPIVLYN